MSPEVTTGTKELVAMVCWLATTLLALDAEVFAGTRGEAVRLYRAHGEKSPDEREWSELVHRIYTRCKLDWGYRVPEHPSERAELRALCGKTLDFANHALRRLERYRGERPPATRSG